MVDWLRAVRYPPECFLDTAVLDAAAGQQVAVNYTVPPGAQYALQLLGFSFARVNAEATVTVDGATRFLEWSDLRAARGLDAEEEARVTAWSSAQVLLTFREGATGYAWRHAVLAFKPSVAVKLAHGRALTSSEASLAERYGLQDLLAAQHLQQFPLDWGVELVKVAAAPASGTVLRAAVKPGRKLVLLSASASGPGAVLALRRDGEDTGVLIHTAALPGLGAGGARMRVVATQSLEVEAVVPAPVHVRLVYGEGRLNLVEKLLWGLRLTEEERAAAERLDLQGRLLAGVL